MDTLMRFGLATKVLVFGSLIDECLLGLWFDFTTLMLRHVFLFRRRSRVA
jgi:hypothetical protein